MKKIFITIFALFLLGVLFFAGKYFFSKKNTPPPAKNITESASNNSSPQNTPAEATPAPPAGENIPADQPSTSAFQPPIDRARERVTKKPFGILITPQTSPVQPERFRGYHTGTDFEIFPEELDADVPVQAICSGKIAVKRFASGYGGVLVENCTLNNQPVTVIYGHLKLASISKNTGDSLAAGDTIGILGKAYSSETDGERKHLHLGIHKGSAVNILGYVQAQAELSGWIDPCSLVCK